jgi:hypothetical protein
MRLLVTGGRWLATWSVGFEWRNLRAKTNLASDTLRVESEIIDIVWSRSKPNQGKRPRKARRVSVARMPVTPLLSRGPEPAGSVISDC